MSTTIDIVPIRPAFPDHLSGPRVAVLAYDGLCTFEFGVACEVFGLSRPEMGVGWYRYAVCAVEPGPLRAAGGLTVAVDRGLDVLEEADLVVVPGWRGVDAPVPDGLAAALRAARGRGARIMSLCSGVAVLAAAGLLDGRRATTHWRYVAAVSARHPAIRFDADVLYVDEGDVLTAAGSAAGIDLCLHVVRGDFGPEAANSVARRLVVPPHRDGGQAQFIAAPVPRRHEAARLGPLIDAMRARPGGDHRLDSLAARAGMSLRTFHRRFAAATGLPPGEWLVLERLRLARELLERPGGASMDAVAEASGFGTAAALRHHFRARIGTSPAAYRDALKRQFEGFDAAGDVRRPGVGQVGLAAVRLGASVLPQVVDHPAGGGAEAGRDDGDEPPEPSHAGAGSQGESQGGGRGLDVVSASGADGNETGHCVARPGQVSIDRPSTAGPLG